MTLNIEPEAVSMPMTRLAAPVLLAVAGLRYGEIYAGKDPAPAPASELAN